MNTQNTTVNIDNIKQFGIGDINPHTGEPMPQGYWLDTKARLIPSSQVEDIDKLRDQLVGNVVEEGIKLNQALQDFKIRAFADIATFVELSAERYGVRIGGKKGNVIAYCYSGEYKIQRAISEHIVCDEGILSAQALIQECLLEWGEGAKPIMIDIVNRAFRVDKEGNLSMNRILELLRIDDDDPRWKQAQNAIKKSLLVTDSTAYIRLYKRNDKGKYDPISLNISAL